MWHKNAMFYHLFSDNYLHSEPLADDIYFVKRNPVECIAQHNSKPRYTVNAYNISVS